MNRDQAAKFLAALNRAQPHLPPLIWDPIADSAVIQMILTVANGMTTCEFKPAIEGEPRPPT